MILFVEVTIRVCLRYTKGLNRISPFEIWTMSVFFAFPSSRVLVPIRGAFARNLRCETSTVKTFSVRACHLRTAPLMSGGGRKTANESAAVSDAIKAGVEKGVAERVMAVMQRASFSNDTSISEFLPWDDASSLVRCATTQIPNLRASVFGGVEEAERGVLACAALRVHDDDESMFESASEHLAAVAMRGDLQNAKGTSLPEVTAHVDNINANLCIVSQRDLLGAVLSHISRERVGDVLIGEDGSGYAIVHAEFASYLASALTSVGRVSVVAETVSLDQVSSRTRKMKEFTTVEKSLRLDAVGSAGFGISRTKMADGIRRGGVRINQRTARTVAKTVRSGDKISFRGYGRIEIVEVDITRKGNMRILVRRYV